MTVQFRRIRRPIRTRNTVVRISTALQKRRSIRLQVGGASWRGSTIGAALEDIFLRICLARQITLFTGQVVSLDARIRSSAS